MLWNFIFKRKGKETQEDPEAPVTPQEQLLARELKEKKETELTDKEKAKRKAKELKEEHKENKKQQKKEKREELKNRISFLLILSIFFIMVYMTPITFANILGHEVVLYGTVVKSSENGRFFITYDFENNLDNIYPDTKPGDKIPLNKMLWETDISTKIEVIDIYEDRFYTELPHIIKLGDSAYNDYLDARQPTRVKLTLKVTGWRQVIKTLERGEGG